MIRPYQTTAKLQVQAQTGRQQEHEQNAAVNAAAAAAEATAKRTKNSNSSNQVRPTPQLNRPQNPSEPFSAKLLEDETPLL